MFNLTNNEKGVILFFVAAILIGSAVHQCKIKHSALSQYTPNAVEERASLPEIVNINSAGERALTYLEGIGPELAERIVEYRLKNGSFLSKEDIMKVKGIGPKKFERIKDAIDL